MNDAITAPSMISEWLWLTGSSMERHAKFFSDKYDLKNIFVTDIHIERPPRKVHEDADVNRKVFHSLNAQIICGANFEILHVGVSSVGSTHDGCARDESEAQLLLREIKFSLLGDSAYSLGSDTVLEKIFKYSVTS